MDILSSNPRTRQSRRNHALRWQRAKAAREALKQARARLTRHDHRLDKAIRRACQEFLACTDKADRQIALNAMVKLHKLRSPEMVAYMEHRAGLRLLHRQRNAPPPSSGWALNQTLAAILRYSPLGGLHLKARA